MTMPEECWGQREGPLPEDDEDEDCWRGVCRLSGQ